MGGRTEEGNFSDSDIEDTSRWNIIYPNYINSFRTVPEGRRIGKAKAIENPQAVEMAEICQFLKIPHKLEMDKAYPRDWLVRGRIRVMLKTCGVVWCGVVWCGVVWCGV